VTASPPARDRSSCCSERSAPHNPADRPPAGSGFRPSTPTEVAAGIMPPATLLHMGMVEAQRDAGIRATANRTRRDRAAPTRGVSPRDCLRCDQRQSTTRCLQDRERSRRTSAIADCDGQPMWGCRGGRGRGGSGRACWGGWAASRGRLDRPGRLAGLVVVRAGSSTSGLTMEAHRELLADLAGARIDHHVPGVGEDSEQARYVHRRRSLPARSVGPGPLSSRLARVATALPGAARRRRRGRR
jgi:hypothetical protein